MGAFIFCTLHFNDLRRHETVCHKPISQDGGITMPQLFGGPRWSRWGSVQAIRVATLQEKMCLRRPSSFADGTVRLNWHGIPTKTP
jgi:hypothetical protein